MKNTGLLYELRNQAEKQTLENVNHKLKLDIASAKTKLHKLDEHYYNDERVSIEHDLEFEGVKGYLEGLERALEIVLLLQVKLIKEVK